MFASKYSSVYLALLSIPRLHFYTDVGHKRFYRENIEEKRNDNPLYRKNRTISLLENQL